MFGGGIVIVGPVEETAFGDLLGAVRTDESGKGVQHQPDILRVPDQEIPVAGCTIVIPHADDEPAGVGVNLIHGLIGARLPDQEFEGIAHDGNIGKRAQQTLDFRVHIPHPDTAVSFGAVIQKILHTEMHGADRSLPDLVEPTVGRLKRTGDFQIAFQRNPDDVLTIDNFVADILNPDEPEHGVAVFRHAVIREIQHCVAAGTVEIRRMETFADRLSEFDMDFPRRPGLIEPDSTMKCRSEIQDERTARREQHRFRLIVNHRLIFQIADQFFRAGNLMVHQNPLNRQVKPGTPVANTIFMKTHESILQYFRSRTLKNVISPASVRA